MRKLRILVQGIFFGLLSRNASASEAVASASPTFSENARFGTTSAFLVVLIGLLVFATIAYLKKLKLSERGPVEEGSEGK